MDVKYIYLPPLSTCWHGTIDSQCRTTRFLVNDFSLMIPHFTSLQYWICLVETQSSKVTPLTIVFGVI